MYCVTCRVTGGIDGERREICFRGTRQQCQSYIAQRPNHEPWAQYRVEVIGK